MLLLAATTDKFQLSTSTAATIDVHVSYVDRSSTTLAASGGGKQNTAISSATTTDILAAPGSSTLRNAEVINIRNKDASLSCDVTVIFDQNGTDFELHKVTLAPGELLTCADGVHWFKYANTALFDQVRYVTANSVHATAATFAAITGLNFDVLSGHNYAVMCALAAITNNTTTGAQFGIGGVAATYVIASGFSVLLGSPTASATITSGVITSVDTAVMAQTTGAAVNQPHIMWCFITPSASGTLSIKATSEVTVAAGLTVLKGSWAHVKETAN